MSIKFGNRRVKSYDVELLDGNMKYSNNRKPHVETPETGLEGKEFELGKRTTRIIGGNIAVMYDVIGVSNGKYPAHITAYFGPMNGCEKDY